MNLVNCVQLLAIIWQFLIQSSQGLDTQPRQNTPNDPSQNLVLLKEMQIKSPLEKNSRIIREILGLVRRWRVECAEQ